MTETEKRSNAWIWQMMVCGFVWGTGNTIYGASIANIAFWGATYTAPAALVSLLLVRMVQIRKTWQQGETWFDKTKSNYYKPKYVANNETEIEKSKEELSSDDFEFDWGTFITVLITQGLPPFASMIVVGMAFKLAFLAQINQGCLTVMFGLGSILTAIVFYFGHGQTISYIKMFGMTLMIGAGLFLGLDEKHADTEEGGLTEEEMSHYGMLAIVVACCAPCLWTFQTFFYVKLLQAGKFSPMDLAYDANTFAYIIGCILHVVYVCGHEYDASALALGSAVGILQVVGMCFMLIAFSTGPGGAVQALVNMQVIWQTLFDALFLGQLVSGQQITGMLFGVSSTLFLTIGDPIKDACLSKAVDQQLEEKQAQNKEPLIGDESKASDKVYSPSNLRAKSIEIEDC